MCKFDSPNAPGFRAVYTDIRAWALEAPSIIGVRWAVEDEERAARLRNDISERMSPYLSPSPDMGMATRSVSPQMGMPLTPVLGPKLKPPPGRRSLEEPGVFTWELEGGREGKRWTGEKDDWARWSASVFELGDAEGLE